jgi:hypothetical protein
MISTYRSTDNDTSVEYKNLYSINGIIYFLTVNDVQLPYVKKFTISYEWKPRIMKFGTEEQLIDYIESLSNIKAIDLSVLSDNLWYGNIGHGLFDVLYPIYLSMLKFGYNEEPFTFLSSEWSWRENMMYDTIKTFTKQELLEYPNLDRDNVYHFKTLIAGTDLAGNRVQNKEVFMYGKQWDGLQQFKKRIFGVHNISIDKPINDIPNIIIINNKRFKEQDILVIEDVVKIMSSVCNIKFIDWYHDYRKHGNPKFIDQMKDFQDVDIQVTAPGTGMMYVPLMKKGAVNINVGFIEHTQTNGVRGNLKILESKHEDHLVPAYMEQPICAGTYYVTTLYYDRYKYNNLETQALIDIINQAIQIVKSGRIIEGNVGKDGEVFREYCKRAQDGDALCKFLTEQSLHVEFFVNEHPYAMLPTTDLDLLRLIKNEFNYDRNYEIYLDQ